MLITRLLQSVILISESASLLEKAVEFEIITTRIDIQKLTEYHINSFCIL